MSGLMEQIASGIEAKPQRIMLYGVHGVGKSTWASLAPKPIFIQTEDGLGGIDCDKFPLATEFADIIAALSELYSNENRYQTIVIDSLDWLEALIWKEVCKKHNVKNIEDIGYAKGYTFAIDYWRQVLDGLTALRALKGTMTIFLAHAGVERFENPATESYDRYVPKLHKKASAVVQEWCDEVLFATYLVHTKSTKEGFDKKRSQGIGTGERTLYTAERPSHVAKNRLNLPYELGMAWDVLAEYIPTAPKAKPRAKK